ncbi:tripartite tricarboxylate transporter substrate binding protein [Shimia sp.]|uniref:Bug family tripartite tricarboxylate transporter substrate binding protein n=1 Tax=Shimia sp. TaxID=1954381 RepID=UPI00329738BF
MKITKLNRRIFGAMAIAAFGASMSLMPNTAQAQSYPDKPVNLIVPTGPGSLVDILARLVGEGMTETWGQQVVVKNIGGAGGSIGAAKLAEAEADGYTLGFVPANLTTHPYLYEIGYDVSADFDAVIRVAGASMVHYVSNDLGVSTVQEFIDHAKAHPGEVTFATAGLGSAANLAAELFQTETGVEMTAIPYKKLNLGVLDVVAGRVSSVFVSAAQGMQFVNEGKLTALGITGLTPNPGAPDLKPIADLGVPGYEFRSWFGFVTPAGVPQDIIATLNAEVLRQTKTEAFQAAIAKAGLELIAGTPQEFADVIDAELVSWKEILSK